MNTEEQFIEELAQIHLKLYHLSLDIDTTWEQAAMVNKIMDGFDDAWDYYKELNSVMGISEEKSREISERGRKAVIERFSVEKDDADVELDALIGNNISDLYEE